MIAVHEGERDERSPFFYINVFFVKKKMYFCGHKISLYESVIHYCRCFERC